MKSKEFIRENSSGSLETGVSHAMPATFIMPGMKNQDVYLQYRFGMALASARAEAEGTPYELESRFGENMVVVARSKEEEETLKMALKLFGTNNSCSQISSSTSSESPDTYSTSLSFKTQADDISQNSCFL